MTSSLKGLIELLKQLPGIGEKSAQRLAFFIMESKRDYALALSQAIQNIKKVIRECKICCNLTQEEICEICKDTKRTQDLICVVSSPQDLMAIERTNSYKGTYHVLHGTIAPLEGIGPERLRIPQLLKRVQKGKIKEIIISTNPNMEGDATALYLLEVLKPLNVEVSRIASGVPHGANIEYIDQITLEKAIEARKKMQ
jgi:recombination protein RecR